MRLNKIALIITIFTSSFSSFSYATLEDEKQQKVYKNNSSDKDYPKDVPLTICKDFPICTEFPNSRVNKNKK